MTTTATEQPYGLPVIVGGKTILITDKADAFSALMLFARLKLAKRFASEHQERYAAKAAEYAADHRQLASIVAKAANQEQDNGQD